MSGLYIHIPFCKSRCIYCAFYSTTRLDLRQRYVDALCREMVRRPAEVSTVYLGGGTPSQLTDAQLRQLFDALYIIYKVEPGAEITIECNPDDITAPFAATLSLLGINRVSMGAQTFDDHRLRFLNRRHTAAQVPQAIRLLRDADIHNISVDLMYGFPGETADDWQRDIDAALALDVEHLSAYCLSIEDNTPLERMNIEEMGEEQERQMYYTLIDRLKAAGYEHYEISNFARPGHRSRHNSSYWNDVPYIGLGAAAHSYDGKCRQWNPSDIGDYIRGDYEPEREAIDDVLRYNDLVMLSLRTCEGICLSRLSTRERQYLLSTARRFIDDGLLVLTDTHLRLSRSALFVSDMIMAELMWV